MKQWIFKVVEIKQQILLYYCLLYFQFLFFLIFFYFNYYFFCRKRLIFCLFLDTKLKKEFQVLLQSS